MSATQIKKELRISITVRRIQKVLHNSPHLKWTECMKKSTLKFHPKTAQNHICLDRLTKFSVYYGEKKFNLDCPCIMEAWSWSVLYDLRNYREVLLR